jgi:hypothetical protein
VYRDVTYALFVALHLLPRATKASPRKTSSAASSSTLPREIYTSLPRPPPPDRDRAPPEIGLDKIWRIIALAETINGTASPSWSGTRRSSRQRRPLGGFRDLEIATCGWVSWFNDAASTKP